MLWADILKVPWPDGEAQRLEPTIFSDARLAPEDEPVIDLLAWLLHHEREAQDDVVEVVGIQFLAQLDPWPRLACVTGEVARRMVLVEHPHASAIDPTVPAPA